MTKKLIINLIIFSLLLLGCSGVRTSIIKEFDGKKNHYN